MRAVLVLALAAFLPSQHEPTPAPKPAPSADQALLLVLNKSDGDVSVIDPRSGATLTKVEVGTGPHEAATSPDGKTVVVCNYGDNTPGNTLSVLDMASRNVTATISLGEHARPHGIVFLPDGKRVLVTSEVRQALIEVDLARGEVTRALPTDQRASHMVALAAGAARAYVADIASGSISVFDLDRSERLAVLPTGAGAEGIACHPSRDEVWVTNRAAHTVSIVAGTEPNVAKQLEAPVFPIRVAFTPDGLHALVSCAQSGEVRVFDVEERREVRKVAMPRKVAADEERGERIFAGAQGPMPIGVLIEPDGKFAFVANTFSDMVTVIDLATWEVVRQIETGRQPDGMTWVPAAKK